jgi:hypothetical protein
MSERPQPVPDLPPLKVGDVVIFKAGCLYAQEGMPRGVVVSVTETLSGFLDRKAREWEMTVWEVMEEYREVIDFDHWPGWKEARQPVVRLYSDPKTKARYEVVLLGGEVDHVLPADDLPGR